MTGNRFETSAFSLIYGATLCSSLVNQWDLFPSYAILWSLIFVLGPYVLIYLLRPDQRIFRKVDDSVHLLASVLFFLLVLSIVSFDLLAHEELVARLSRACIFYVACLCFYRLIRSLILTTPQ